MPDLIASDRALAAGSGAKQDNVGLAAEFAVASVLTNAGWFAAEEFREAWRLIEPPGGVEPAA